MKLTTQRRLAANVLKCGRQRIWFDPARLQEIKEAITRQDIRSLINDLAIQKHSMNIISGFRRKKIAAQKRKGRRSGPGSRKGTSNARLDAKTNWIRKIRAQRRFLRALKQRRAITPPIFRELYRKAKGGFFRSTAHIQRHLEEHELVKHEKKKDSTPAQEKKAR